MTITNILKKKINGEKEFVERRREEVPRSNVYHEETRKGNVECETTYARILL